MQFPSHIKYPHSSIVTMILSFHYCFTQCSFHYTSNIIIPVLLTQILSFQYCSHRCVAVSITHQVLSFQYFWHWYYSSQYCFKSTCVLILSFQYCFTQMSHVLCVAVSITHQILSFHYCWHWYHHFSIVSHKCSFPLHIKYYHSSIVDTDIIISVPQMCCSFHHTSSIIFPVFLTLILYHLSIVSNRRVLYSITHQLLSFQYCWHWYFHFSIVKWFTQMCLCCNFHHTSILSFQ